MPAWRCIGFKHAETVAESRKMAAKPLSRPCARRHQHADKQHRQSRLSAARWATSGGDCARRHLSNQLHHRLQLQSYGHPARLYQRLRQPAALCGAGAPARPQTAAGLDASFSPELFVNIASDGLITTEPMKGTAPVLGDGGDEARAQALEADPKNRAENIMIVDFAAQ